jgi:hypothetical protein
MAEEGGILLFFTFIRNFIISNFGANDNITNMIQILLLAGVIILISFVIWLFSESVSKKDLIKLNLSQYNTYEHPTISKFFGFLFYFIEYMVIIPVFLILWYFALALSIFFSIQSISFNYVILVTASLIIAVRVLAYFRGDFAKDLSKVFPFITLSLFLLNPTDFTKIVLIDRVNEFIQLLPTFFLYFSMVFFIEVLFRFIDTIQDLNRDEEDKVYSWGN